MSAEKCDQLSSEGEARTGEGCKATCRAEQSAALCRSTSEVSSSTSGGKQRWEEIEAMVNSSNQRGEICGGDKADAPTPSCLHECEESDLSQEYPPQVTKALPEYTAASGLSLGILSPPATSSENLSDNFSPPEPILTSVIDLTTHTSTSASASALTTALATSASASALTTALATSASASALTTALATSASASASALTTVLATSASASALTTVLATSASASALTTALATSASASALTTALATSASASALRLAAATPTSSAPAAEREHSGSAAGLEPRPKRQAAQTATWLTDAVLNPGGNQYVWSRTADWTCTNTKRSATLSSTRRTANSSANRTPAKRGRRAKSTARTTSLSITDTSVTFATACKRPVTLTETSGSDASPETPLDKVDVLRSKLANIGRIARTPTLSSGHLKELKGTFKNLWADIERQQFICLKAKQSFLRKYKSVQNAESWPKEEIEKGRQLSSNIRLLSNLVSQCGDLGDIFSANDVPRDTPPSTTSAVQDAACAGQPTVAFAPAASVMVDSDASASALGSQQQPQTVHRGVSECSTQPPRVSSAFHKPPPAVHASPAPAVAPLSAPAQQPAHILHPMPLRQTAAMLASDRDNMLAVSRASATSNAVAATDDIATSNAMNQFSNMEHEVNGRGRGSRPSPPDAIAQGVACPSVIQEYVQEQSSALCASSSSVISDTVHSLSFSQSTDGGDMASTASTQYTEEPDGVGNTGTSGMTTHFLPRTDTMPGCENEPMSPPLLAGTLVTAASRPGMQSTPSDNATVSLCTSQQKEFTAAAAAIAGASPSLAQDTTPMPAWVNSTLDFLNGHVGDLATCRQTPGVMSETRDGGVQGDQPGSVSMLPLPMLSQPVQRQHSSDHNQHNAPSSGLMARDADGTRPLPTHVDSTSSSVVQLNRPVHRNAGSLATGCTMPGITSTSGRQQHGCDSLDDFSQLSEYVDTLESRRGSNTRTVAGPGMPLVQVSAATINLTTTAAHKSASSRATMPVSASTAVTSPVHTASNNKKASGRTSQPSSTSLPTLNDMMEAGIVRPGSNMLTLSVPMSERNPSSQQHQQPSGNARIFTASLLPDGTIECAGGERFSTLHFWATVCTSTASSSSLSKSIKTSKLYSLVHANGVSLEEHAANWAIQVQQEKSSHIANTPPVHTLNTKQSARAADTSSSNSNIPSCAASPRGTATHAVTSATMTTGCAGEARPPATRGVALTWPPSRLYGFHRIIPERFEWMTDSQCEWTNTVFVQQCYKHITDPMF